MACWLMKSEPEEFSIDDLRARPTRTEPWDGVRNYQARNMMRDEMRKGDLVFFYHSNCETPGIAGIAKIVREGYPDPTVVRIATQTVRGELDPGFVGDMAKSTGSSNSAKVEGNEERVVQHLMKEVQADRMWGPLSACPFTVSRRCRLSIAPKFKWDEARPEFRLISDFSEFGSSSVNDLCYSPRLMSFHLLGGNSSYRLGHSCRVAHVEPVKGHQRHVGWRRPPPLTHRRVGRGSHHVPLEPHA